MNKGAEKVTDNGVDMDIPFDDIKSTKEDITRTELMQKTGKELAKIALPYTNLKEVTLTKLSKAELCDIILTKGANREQTEPKARANRAKSDSEAIIDTFLAIAESFKLKREQEPLNAAAKQIFKNNAVNIVDKKVEDETVSSHGVNTAVVIVAGAFLAIDGIIGLANIPTFLGKLKSKFNANRTKTK
ncbi:hypothetical protein [Sulfurospirillum sp. 1612]|uniref:hypothetical protein n=1 Tax=Sulfurospirillum sp. 1612 TaxID=3094835 RepID=UPI002F9263FB